MMLVEIISGHLIIKTLISQMSLMSINLNLIKERLLIMDIRLLKNKTIKITLQKSIKGLQVIVSIISNKALEVIRKITNFKIENLQNIKGGKDQLQIGNLIITLMDQQSEVFRFKIKKIKDLVLTKELLIFLLRKLDINNKHILLNGFKILN